MQKELLHKYALTKSGAIVKADNAQKGEEYFCPGCNGEFIFKNSGNTGKGSRRAHFAHKALEPNCSHESYLHNAFKIMALEIIKDHISKGVPLNIAWKCNYCHGAHNGTLAPFDAKIEFNLKECRPDIALFDQNGRVFAVIEVVYKHPPEDGTRKFYKDNQICLIQVDVSSDEDLENIEYKVKNPTSVDACFAQRPVQQILTLQYLQYLQLLAGLNSMPRRTGVSCAPRRSGGPLIDRIENQRRYRSNHGKPRNPRRKH